ncbi:MAG: dTDP-4-amino-4,6-dideoxygalactose transaminase [Bacteroidales bacterium]|nr:dTDP-4-amino-4,6-dideoxygalactose transaminase [Bacteroidales bacterium]
MTDIRIDFNKPTTIGNEMDYIKHSFEVSHISGDGIFTKKSQELLEKELGVPKVVLTTSCTHALEMAALLINIHPGDEVIMPSFTFVSTANAFVLRGAKPVFVDIRPDILNIDEQKIEQAITKKTKAICVIHYAGIASEMNQILKVAKKYNLRVIEDNAHSLFGKYQNKPLGTFGSLAAQSFHETKNFTCGEGGALLINDLDLINRAEIIREKGTNRSHFFRGMVDKYTWVDVGSSYLPSDILASILFAQLENFEYIQNFRKSIWETYSLGLDQWARSNGVILPSVPEGCDPAYHIFYMLFPDLNIRQRFIRYMKEKGIITVFHYQPLHLSEMGKQFGGSPGDCPVTELVSDTLVRLPYHLGLSNYNLISVIEAISEFKL